MELLKSHFDFLISCTRPQEVYARLNRTLVQSEIQLHSLYIIKNPTPLTVIGQKQMPTVLYLAFFVLQLGSTDPMIYILPLSYVQKSGLNFVLNTSEDRVFEQ